MIRQLGTPTWFFTMSAADLQWPDLIRTIARQYGVHYQSDEEVAKLYFEDPTGLDEILLLLLVISNIKLTLFSMMYSSLLLIHLEKSLMKPCV